MLSRLTKPPRMREFLHTICHTMKYKTDPEKALIESFLAMLSMGVRFARLRGVQVRIARRGCKVYKPLSNTSGHVYLHLKHPDGMLVTGFDVIEIDDLDVLGKDRTEVTPVHPVPPKGITSL